MSLSGPNPVYVDFAVRNVDTVLKAMSSIGDVVARTGRGSIRATNDAARAQERAYGQAARTIEGWQRQQARAAEQAARASARAAERSARDQERAVAQAARQQERAHAQTAKDAARHLRDQVKEAERASKDATKAAERQARDEAAAAERSARDRARVEEQEARSKIRSMERAFREEQRQQRASLREAEQDARRRDAIRERSASMAGRYAAQQARDEARALRRVQAEMDRRNEAQSRRYAEAIVGGGGKAFGHMVRGGTALTRLALDLGGGFSVQEALKDQMNLERNAIQFSNAAFQNRPGEKRIDKGEIQERSRVNAIKTGTDAAELLKGAQAYGAKSGAYQEGLDLQEFFGKVSKGTEASVADVAATAGLLRVQNKDLSTKEMKTLILNTIRAGQRGSIEFSELSKVAGKVTRSSASYAGDQGKNQGKLLGLAQIAMRTSGNPHEAATVLANLSSDALKHRDEVEYTLGKGAFNEKGQIARAPEEFLADLMEKTGGNLATLQDMKFGQRSMKMFQALAPTFNVAEKKALDAGAKPEEARKAGRAAVLADMKEMTDASMSVEELEKNVAEIMQSSAEQFEAAVRELKTVVGQELTPVIKDLAPLIKKATPPLRDFLAALVKMVRFARDNPLAAIVAGFGVAISGLAVSIGAEVTKQIVAAKIGEVIKGLLSGGGGGVPPVGGSLGGVGKALAVVGAGVAAGEATKEFVDSGFKEEKDKDDARRSRQIEARNLAVEATKGPLTEEQRKRAIELTRQLQADKANMANEMDPVNAPLVKKVTGAIGNVVAPTEMREAQQVEQREQSRSLAMTEQASKKLIEALERNTRATEANSRNNGGGGGGSAGGPSVVDPSDPRRSLPANRRNDYPPRR